MNNQSDNKPKPLDWMVAAGFVLFMVALIIAMTTENLRWLGGAFVIMTIVIGFGLSNNIKNMQPDWGSDGDDIEIEVPNAPESLIRASGSSSSNHNSKWDYWKGMVWFMGATLLFFVLGLLLLFTDLGRSF